MNELVSEWVNEWVTGWNDIIIVKIYILLYSQYERSFSIDINEWK